MQGQLPSTNPSIRDCLRQLAYEVGTIITDVTECPETKRRDYTACEIRYIHMTGRATVRVWKEEGESALRGFERYQGVADVICDERGNRNDTLAFTLGL